MGVTSSNHIFILDLKEFRRRKRIDRMLSWRDKIEFLFRPEARGDDGCRAEGMSAGESDRPPPSGGTIPGSADPASLGGCDRGLLSGPSAMFGGRQCGRDGPKSKRSKGLWLSGRAFPIPRGGQVTRAADDTMTPSRRFFSDRQGENRCDTSRKNSASTMEGYIVLVWRWIRRLPPFSVERPFRGQRE
jgi:hypothetical protein